MIGKAELAATAWRRLGGPIGLPSLIRWRGLLCLNYHRIGDWHASPLDRGVYSTTEEMFAEQMAFLARSRDLEVITPADLPQARRDPRGRYVMITFDDGYRDNVDLAVPILKRERIPATFFIASGFIDDATVSWWDRIAWMIRQSAEAGASRLPGSAWWGDPLPLADPDATEHAIWTVLEAYKRTPSAQTPDLMAELESATQQQVPASLGDGLWMTWENVRELHAAGMGIGGHTHSHPLLGRLDPALQAEEISRCRERLLDAAGVRPTAFAYPVGSTDSFSATTQSLLAANGFEFAFSFYGGYQTMDELDPLDIRRAPIARHMTQTRFEATTTLPRVFAR